jgi:subtilisin family serine protease
MNHPRPAPALFLLCIFIAASLQAQERVKMGFELMDHLAWPHAADAQVDLFIHGPSDVVGQAVRGHGGIVKQSLPRLVNARVPVSAVNALAAHDAVELFEFSLAPAELLNDSARVKSRIDLVHAGAAPLPAAYTGRGVVMGIIDTGVDPYHPDFLDEFGGPRVFKYWDQTLATGPLTPQQYGYGVVWESSHLNSGTITSTDNSAHGTTVAGIAAGNAGANGMHKGMAPESRILVVKYTGAGNFTSNVADAVHFIFQEAQALGLPAVVNISLGRRLGSHDGKDAAALLIDAMIQEQAGRVVVAASGNWNEWDPYHMRTQVTSDTSFTWFGYNPQMTFSPGVTGGVYFEAWADIADLQNVQYAIGADRVTPGYQFRGRTPFRNVAQNLNTVITDTLYSTSGNRLGVAEMLVLPRGGQYQLIVRMVQPDSSAYHFRFMSTGSGKFDVWSLAFDGWSQMLPYTWPSIVNVPTVAQYPAMAKYVFPDNNKHVADSWACSPHVITVGNYRNETGYIAYDGSIQQGPGTEGEITVSSSRGPTRDDRIKPEIGAPGDLTFSPPPLATLTWLLQNEPFKLSQGGWHMRGGGTSAASPHIAGAVALYLEKCPWADHTEVREALFSTARVDAFTGAVPNNTFGYGKLDAFAMLNTSNLEDFQLVFSGDNPFCDGQQVMFTAPDDFTAYLWSTGATEGPVHHAGEAGEIHVTAFDASGCQARSDTILLTTLPSPDMPVVTVDENLLSTTPAVGYQWYFNGTPLPDAVQQQLVAYQQGAYHVEVFNEHGCSTESDPVMVIITNVEELENGMIAFWPSPARDELNVRMTGPEIHRLSILDANGRTVVDRQLNGARNVVLSLSHLSAGPYFLKAEGGEEQVLHRFVKLP